MISINQQLPSGITFDNSFPQGIERVNTLTNRKLNQVMNIPTSIEDFLYGEYFIKILEGVYMRNPNAFFGFNLLFQSIKNGSLGNEPQLNNILQSQLVTFLSKSEVKIDLELEFEKFHIKTMNSCTDIQLQSLINYIEPITTSGEFVKTQIFKKVFSDTCNQLDIFKKAGPYYSGDEIVNVLESGPVDCDRYIELAQFAFSSLDFVTTYFKNIQNQVTKNGVGYNAFMSPANITAHFSHFSYNHINSIESYLHSQRFQQTYKKFRKDLMSKNFSPIIDENKGDILGELDQYVFAGKTMNMKAVELLGKLFSDMHVKKHFDMLVANAPEEKRAYINATSIEEFLTDAMVDMKGTKQTKELITKLRNANSLLNQERNNPDFHHNIIELFNKEDYFKNGFEYGDIVGDNWTNKSPKRFDYNMIKLVIQRGSESPKNRGPVYEKVLELIFNNTVFSDDYEVLLKDKRKTISSANQDEEIQKEKGREKSRQTLISNIPQEKIIFPSNTEETPKKKSFFSKVFGGIKNFFSL